MGYCNDWEKTIFFRNPGYSSNAGVPGYEQHSTRHLRCLNHGANWNSYASELVLAMARESISYWEPLWWAYTSPTQWVNHMKSNFWPGSHRNHGPRKRRASHRCLKFRPTGSHRCLWVLSPQDTERKSGCWIRMSSFRMFQPSFVKPPSQTYHWGSMKPQQPVIRDH